MKKSLRFTAAGLSICMMAAMLAGCSSSSSTDTVSYTHLTLPTNGDV